jgi:hypothetical protein
MRQILQEASANGGVAKNLPMEIEQMTLSDCPNERTLLAAG